MNSQSKYHLTPADLANEALIIEESKINPSAFRPIYEKYYGAIVNYIYLRLDDKELAFDLAQQTFYKALQKINQYENRGLPFSSWLYRIAHNELNELFRKDSKLRTVNLTDKLSASLKSELEDEEVSEWIVKLKFVIKQLKESDFRIVEMRFFEELPFSEIGEILGLTENNAKVKTYRILDKMKSALLQAK